MQWICTICGYIHDGDNPPEVCPICEAPREHFVEAEREESP